MQLASTHLLISYLNTFKYKKKKSHLKPEI